MFRTIFLRARCLPALVLLLFQCGSTALAMDACRIVVTDAENGWPVPLVELRTTHHVRLVSDNAGVIAIDLPELMGVETWFHVRGHGYSVPADGFGYRGVRLTPEPGKTLSIKVQRQLPAKRLGRLTGAGLFAESQKCGLRTDWREQGVFGCDSVQNALHRGKLFWVWGDTTLPGYPLGRFHAVGATTVPQPLNQFKPPIELRYDYFRDSDGLPRNLAEMPGDGPTWLSGLVSLKDVQGRARLGAVYSKIRPPLKEYERGLCVWNESEGQFEHFKTLWQESAQARRSDRAPVGHATLWTDDEGVRWVLFGDPFPMMRCRATFEEWSDPARWESLQPQQEVPIKGSAESIRPHRGAICFHDHRDRWISLFTQWGGESSQLGELWFAEADSPMGPWRDAVQVVTHDQYTFYNPQLHPEMAEDGSPFVLFEATYTRTFSKTSDPTPRYDYNQILYRLDLDEL